ncbi:MAG: hypothetical protein R2882_07815 [Gemmatimonadales bacterium]
MTLVRGGDQATARRILEPFWRVVTVEGRVVAAGQPHGRFYFESAVRTAGPPAARHAGGRSVA